MAATESVTTIAQGVRALSTPINPVECEVGSNIGAIYLSVYILGDSGSNSGLVDWYIWKEPGDIVTTANEPVPGNTGISVLRRFIFHEAKGLFATQDGTPMVEKIVVRIPPRYRRMGDNDKFVVKILSPTTGEFCIKAIYKTFR